MINALRWYTNFIRNHKAAMLGSICLATILTVAIAGPLLCQYSPVDSIFDAGLNPSSKHWLGTDTQGRDLAARFIYGSHTTIKIALLATLLSTVLGTTIGAVSGYIGGKTDLILMRFIDYTMSFPGFLLAMVIVAIAGRELNNLIYAVGIVGAPLFARQIRSEVLRIVALDYITAAKAIGASHTRIIFVHILKNALSPIIVLATLSMGGAILDIAGLNFLGLGGDPYQVPEWGLILKQGWDEAPALKDGMLNIGAIQVLTACLLIFITVLGFNLIGDGLKDQIDPKSKQR